MADRASECCLSENSGTWDVSADGATVVGMSWSELGAEAFLWTEAEGMIGLGDLPGGDYSSSALGISADGSTVVGRSSAELGIEASRWTASEGMEMLPRSEGMPPDAVALAVSADGSIIVGRCVGFGTAFIWNASGGMRLLRDELVEVYGLEAELAGWSLVQAQSISDDGSVLVGYGGNDGVGYTGWIASIPELLEPVPGDFDGDKSFTAADIDLLSAEVLEGIDLAQFDLTDDELVDGADRIQWVEVLKNTFFGDANLDGEFNSTDFVSVFQVGEYEDLIVGNSGWADGDWNGDTEFTSSDFAMAFQRGGYEQGPRQQVRAVPEPASWLLIGFGLLTFSGWGRWRHAPANVLRKIEQHPADEHEMRRRSKCGFQRTRFTPCCNGFQPAFRRSRFCDIGVDTSSPRPWHWCLHKPRSSLASPFHPPSGRGHPHETRRFPASPFHPLSGRGHPHETRRSPVSPFHPPSGRVEL